MVPSDPPVVDCCHPQLLDLAKFPLLHRLLPPSPPSMVNDAFPPTPMLPSFIGAIPHLLWQEDDTGSYLYRVHVSNGEWWKEEVYNNDW